MKEIFLNGTFLNMIFIFETQSYFYSWLWGCYAWNLHRSCHCDVLLLEPWSGLVCMLQSRMISVVIQFCSLGCTNSTTANEDGVHFTAIYDWRTETGTWLYIYVQSRQLSTFLIKLRENLNNYGENMLQTRCRTSVTPIIKTQYGPHSFSRLSSEKLLSCSMQRWKERYVDIERYIESIFRESDFIIE